MEKRMALPGYVFLSGIINETNVKKILHWEREDGQKDFIIPCEMPYLKELCQENNLIKMSRGIIRRGVTVVFSGPLKGRERLIQRIDRHKRTADIEIPFAGDKKQVTVGLEICEKETLRDRQ